jgi:hypothetical protein
LSRPTLPRWGAGAPEARRAGVVDPPEPGDVLSPLSGRQPVMTEGEPEREGMGEYVLSHGVLPLREPTGNVRCCAVNRVVR